MKDTMIEQLKELLEMQRVLDEAILEEHGLVYDDKIAEQNRIALFVELGELMNELPSYFKHWKKNKVDNREKALIEYVDALHFMLSLFNYYEYEIVEEYNNYNRNHDDGFWSISECLVDTVSAYSLDIALSDFFSLGNSLGFTWEEIYRAYKDKNAVNYERLKNGY